MTNHLTSQETIQDNGDLRQDNVVYFSKSLELRARALEVARRARACPIGPARNKLRQIARALRALADNEAWLHGRIEPRRRQYGRRNAHGA
ncbi:hypothetical protein [Bradyrhizobium prioriisuperbiae]|uniref:hypothetical protein n=1 Tax=Bradyrhizobium prioriisuperbiae TaxID=2854389 RepID=UPI0028E696CE|nr:hypothetical protein [Bradyrhizobium prioritasuperba]